MTHILLQTQTYTQKLKHIHYTYTLDAYYMRGVSDKVEWHMYRVVFFLKFIS